MTLADREIPTAVVCGSGSYTIPAGKYAYVTAQVKTGSRFAIDGTVVMDSNGDTTTWVANSGDTARGYGYTSAGGGIYKLPQGTVITGTGLGGTGNGLWAAQLFDMVVNS